MNSAEESEARTALMAEQVSAVREADYTHESITTALEACFEAGVLIKNLPPLPRGTLEIYVADIQSEFLRRLLVQATRDRRLTDEIEKRIRIELEFQEWLPGDALRVEVINDVNTRDVSSSLGGFGSAPLWSGFPVEVDEEPTSEVESTGINLSKAWKALNDAFGIQAQQFAGATNKDVGTISDSRHNRTGIRSNPQYKTFVVSAIELLPEKDRDWLNREVGSIARK